MCCRYNFWNSANISQLNVFLLTQDLEDIPIFQSDSATDWEWVFAQARYILIANCRLHPHGQYDYLYCSISEDYLFDVNYYEVKVEAKMLKSTELGIVPTTSLAIDEIIFYDNCNEITTPQPPSSTTELTTTPLPSVRCF